ncbi:MAG: putative ATP-dependent helicase dinG [Pseudomonadota bacterium]
MLQQQAHEALDVNGPLHLHLQGFRPRASQQALATSIANALAHRETLVAEAGTGTGKTFAYLVPLLLSGARALISTGTRPLQDQLHERDLPAVRAALGIDLHSALLKGRANYVCPYHLARHLQEGRFPDPAIGPQLRRIAVFAQGSTTGDRAHCSGVAEDDPAWIWATSTRDNCLGQECPEIRRCFLMKARREAQAADVVVVNHHLFLADLSLRDESLAELLPSVDAVIFDEAHQLPEAATEFFGDSVSTRQLIDFARDLVKAGLVQAPDGADWRNLSGRLEHAVRALRLVLDNSPTWPFMAGDTGKRAHDRTRPMRAEGRANRRYASDELRALESLPDALEDLATELVSVCAITAANAGRGPELDRCGLRSSDLLATLQAWMGALEGAADEKAVVWAEVSAQTAVLRLTPLSVAEPFRRHREALSQSWVFLSATLTLAEDFSHYTRALGLEGVRCERWESPFDFQRQAALWIPSDLGEPGAPGFAARMAHAIWPLLAANRGRAFVLCTSLRGLRETAQALRALDTMDMQWLVQGESPRAELLERFRASQKPSVLVGSATFWEGVDVSGDALSVVVIDKLPFAPPDDPVIQARALALRQAGRDPFRHDQLPQAALMLKQGAGRLIRSETDRGVLVIADARVRTRGYGRQLLASLPPFCQVKSLEQAMQFLPV